MKKTQTTKNKGGRYRIECRFADEVLVPSEAIERAYYERATPFTEDEFITLDGKVCSAEFVMTWRDINTSLMDIFCESHLGMKFSTVRSLWLERLGVRYGLTCWHYIKLHGL